MLLMILYSNECRGVSFSMPSLFDVASAAFADSIREVLEGVVPKHPTEIKRALNSVVFNIIDDKPVKFCFFIIVVVTIVVVLGVFRFKKIVK